VCVWCAAVSVGGHRSVGVERGASRRRGERVATYYSEGRGGGGSIVVVLLWQRLMLSWHGGTVGEPRSPPATPLRTHSLQTHSIGLGPLRTTIETHRCHLGEPAQWNECSRRIARCSRNRARAQCAPRTAPGLAKTVLLMPPAPGSTRFAKDFAPCCLHEARCVTGFTH
jgi:hypothetical protein